MEKGDSRARVTRYANTRLAPVLHQIIEDLLLHRPTDPVKFLQSYINENGDALRDKIQTSVVASIADAPEGDVSAETRELLLRIERLENEKEALKRIGKTEISRLKIELEKKDARLKELEGGGSKTAVVEEAASQPTKPEETLDQVWTEHLHGMHPLVAELGMDVSHFLGVGLSALSPMALQHLINAWQALADDGREMLPQEAEYSSHPPPPASSSEQDRLLEHLHTSLAGVAESGSRDLNSLVEISVRLSQHIAASPSSFVVCESAETRAAVVKAVFEAHVASDIAVDLTELSDIESSDFASLIATLAVAESGEESWEDGDFSAVCRGAAEALAGNGSVQQWVVLHGDLSVSVLEQFKALIHAEKEVSVPGREPVPLQGLKFIFETDDPTNVPHDLATFAVTL